MRFIYPLTFSWTSIHDTWRVLASLMGRWWRDCGQPFVVMHAWLRKCDPHRVDILSDVFLFVGRKATQKLSTCLMYVSLQVPLFGVFPCHAQVYTYHGNLWRPRNCISLWTRNWSSSSVAALVSGCALLTEIDVSCVCPYICTVIGAVHCSVYQSKHDCSVEGHPLCMQYTTCNLTIAPVDGIVSFIGCYLHRLDVRVPIAIVVCTVQCSSANIHIALCLALHCREPTPFCWCCEDIGKTIGKV